MGTGGGVAETPTLYFYVANFSLKKPITSREKLCRGGAGGLGTSMLSEY